MRELPHLVLDGAAVAARAVGARKAIIVLPGSDDRSARSLHAALRDRRHTRVREDPRFEVFAIDQRYLAGQESALVNALNGGPGLPTLTPPRPFESGVRRRPTLVQNVETLAHLALLYPQLTQPPTVSSDRSPPAPKRTSSGSRFSRPCSTDRRRSTPSTSTQRSRSGTTPTDPLPGRSATPPATHSPSTSTPPCCARPTGRFHRQPLPPPEPFGRSVVRLPDHHQRRRRHHHPACPSTDGSLSPPDLAHDGPQTSGRAHSCCANRGPIPARPHPLPNGKEGVWGSSPQEGLGLCRICRESRPSCVQRAHLPARIRSRFGPNT